jgi:hypothetical protein
MRNCLSTGFELPTPSLLRSFDFAVLTILHALVITNKLNNVHVEHCSSSVLICVLQVIGHERREITISDSTRSLTTCEGENMHGSRPETWYESDRLPDKPDRLPDSTDASCKSLDTVDTTDKLPDTVDTSDKSPDTVDEALPHSTKGRVTGSPDTTPQPTVKS